jgi:hypothetical protein
MYLVCTFVVSRSIVNVTKKWARNFEWTLLFRAHFFDRKIFILFIGYYIKNTRRWSYARIRVIPPEIPLRLHSKYNSMSSIQWYFRIFHNWNHLSEKAKIRVCEIQTQLYLRKYTCDLCNSLWYSFFV